MEIEDDEYVSIEDSEVCPVDSGTNYWNTVFGPSGVADGILPDYFADNRQFVQEESIQDLEEEEEQEEDIREPLNFELQQGYRILRELMAESNKSVNWHFLEAVDDSYPETQDYYDRIKSPMWLEKMNEKFHQRQYETITQFVSDFRLMLENCFRYNGPDHYVSKRGQRLETMLEQKLALLSRDLREKTSITATSGQSASNDAFSASGLRRRIKAIVPHDSSALLNHLREEELKAQREQRRQVIADRKAAQEAYLHNLHDWENELMRSELNQVQLKAMWELPAIGHFLFLCQDPLNMEEVAQYELERSFMMPRQSSTMQRIMSSLLSTPFQRTKLDKKTMMPYCVWEEKLRKRTTVWYKTFDDNHGNAHKAAYKLGIDAFFFDVAGKKNPLLKKKFHELSFYRKVWIVKSLCDNCVETQESLRDAIEVQAVEEQRSYILGQDGKGNTYIHFPQFCGADLRVYRQEPLPEPEIYSSEDEEENEESDEEEEDKMSTPPVKTPPVKKRKVESSSKMAVNTSTNKPSASRRSSRRGQKADPEDTETENTPSEVSTDPGSRSLTATPEIVENMDEEGAPVRRTRSGRSARRNLYHNGLTRDLERSLRRLRRQNRLEDKKPECEGSPSIASDSEREYSSATDSNHNNNNCGSVPDDQETVAPDNSDKRESSERLESDRCEEETEAAQSRNSDFIYSCDSENVKTECERSDISVSEAKLKPNSVDVDPETCNRGLCKENMNRDVKLCNGSHVDDDSKSAINIGDISLKDDQCDSARTRAGKGGRGETDTGKGDNSDRENLDVNSTGIEKCAQVIANGAESKDKCPNDTGTNVKVEPDTETSTKNEPETETSTNNKPDTETSTKNEPDVETSIKNASYVGTSIKDEPVAATSTGDCVHESVETDTMLLPPDGDGIQTDNASEVKTETTSWDVDTNVDDGNEKTEVKPVAGYRTAEEKKEEEEESEDELQTPEIGAFELMADSVEDLRLLAEKFAEPAEPPPPVSTRGKKAKAWRPPNRKRCVKELHDRLLYLLKELEPWESKLMQARRKAQVKMRKELDEYKEVIVKEQEAEDWNTEDSSSGDDTDTEMNGHANIKEEESKTKRTVTAPSIQSTDSRDSFVGNAEDEYELDVSSRGRLRKRRVIPNNIEDQGIKKKKMQKSGEDTGTVAHLPNILQKQLKPTASQYTLSAPGIYTTPNPMQSMSASQILRMSILGQTQARTSLTSASITNVQLSTGGVSVTQSSHPVIQSLLTTRGQQIAPTVLRQVRPRPAVMHTLKPQPAKQSGVLIPNTFPPAKQTLEVTGGNTASSTQKILNSLPASVIQQLLKHKAIKIQTTGPGGTTLFLTSAVPTSTVLAPTTPTQPQSVVQQQQPITLTQHINTLSEQATTTNSVVSSLTVPPGIDTIVTISSGSTAVTQSVFPRSSTSCMPITPQLNTLSLPVSSVLTSAKPVQQTVHITTSPKSVILNHQVEPSTNTLAASPLLLTDTDHASVKTPYLSPTPASPSKQKYASNVTVKALLENRAFQKATDIQTVVTSRSDSLEGVEIVTTAAGAKSNVSLCKADLPISGVQFKPRVLKIPSQEALDSVLQSVMTSVSTSLPTANIKVPSPVTLPFIQPRRNITKTIQSMKAPILVTHKVESNPAITMSPSSFSQSASQSVTSVPHTQVSTKSTIKTGYVLQNPVSATNANQKNVLLKVVPQNLFTSQGLVQGFLTPQGLVIPQQKQAVVPVTASAHIGASAPISAVHTTNAVQMMLTSAKEIVEQTVADSAVLKSVVSNPVIVTQAGKQIQLSFSPVKQSVPLSSTQPLTSFLANTQQTGSKISSSTAIPTMSAIQSHASLTSATFTTASKSGKGMKTSQIQTKVATPAAELVKQIAAGQSSNTRMIIPSSGHVLQGKPSSGIATLMTRTPVSGHQAASVIPALMVGQPALANTPATPRLLVPAQQLVGTPLQPGKTVNLCSPSEVANNQPLATSGPTLQLSGKQPTTPFVLSLGSGLQTVMLSPNKDATSHSANQVHTAAVQISVPQTSVKTTPIKPGVTTLQLPVQPVMKLTPAQQLASTVQVASPGPAGLQLVQQQVAGASQTAAPKQILLSPQQVGNITIPSGVKMVPQQPVVSGIQTLVNKAAPHLLNQKMNTLQVAAAGSQSDSKSPLLLQQQILPLATNATGQILQIGQQQIIINKSIPQQSVLANQSPQGGTIQPSLKIIQSPSVVQPSPVLQLQATVPSACSAVAASPQNLATSRANIQAAQPATKAALQAHLNQTKPTVLHGLKPEMPTLSTILGHEKGKAIITNPLHVVSQKQVLKTVDIPQILQASTTSSMFATPTAARTANATPVKTNATNEGESPVLGGSVGSKQQKLLLYNIGGHLMTAQGVPVTVEQGVLKVVPQATIQIGNQMLTIKSPSSAMVENHDASRKNTKPALSSLQDNSVSTVAPITSPITGPASSSVGFLQANIQTAAGLNSTAAKPKVASDTRLHHQTGSTTTVQLATDQLHGFITRAQDNNTSSRKQAVPPAIPTDANSVATVKHTDINSVPGTGQLVSNSEVAVANSPITVDHTKPLLQKSGSREEAALNLLSLANMSER